MVVRSTLRCRRDEAAKEWNLSLQYDHLVVQTLHGPLTDDAIRGFLPRLKDAPGRRILVRLNRGGSFRPVHAIGVQLEVLPPGSIAQQVKRELDFFYVVAPGPRRDMCRIADQTCFQPFVTSRRREQLTFERHIRPLKYRSLEQITSEHHITTVRANTDNSL